MRMIGLMIALLLTPLVAACGAEPSGNEVAARGGGGSDALTYGLLGFVAGQALAPSPTQVVHERIRHVPVYAGGRRTGPTPARSLATTPAPKVRFSFTPMRSSGFSSYRPSFRSSFRR